ncbi:hypothetical protein DAI22_12g074800 [Oryza sativa Japonica Group]|nr:hypothetical protein DAI22_12g074800 [Oryza sativa Japonica Group]
MHAFLFFMFICLACRQSGCASCFGDIWHSMLILSFFFPSPSLFSCYSLRFFLLPSFRSSIWCVVISPCHGRWLMLPVVVFLTCFPVFWVSYLCGYVVLLGWIFLSSFLRLAEMSDPLVHLFIGLTVYSLPAILAALNRKRRRLAIMRRSCDLG